MSYEVRDGYLWDVRESPDSDDIRMGPIKTHVDYALDVLRAAWGPDAVATEEGKYLPYPHIEEMKQGYGTHDRTVVRSPWREVDRG